MTMFEIIMNLKAALFLKVKEEKYQAFNHDSSCVH